MSARHCTRRDLLETLIWRALPACIASTRLASAAPGAAFRSRRYRINATILLFGAPILTRGGVGGAYLEKQQRTTAEGNAVSLEFAAGSWPDRAHGIHRMGFFQETQEVRRGDATHAGFFGFMTSSPEKDIAEARRSLIAGGGEHYIAVTGEGSRGRFHCRRAEVDLPPGQKWEQCGQLSGDLRHRLEEPAALSADVETGNAQSSTFLDSVRQAMLSPRDRHEALFVHNAKRYRLTALRRPDPGVAAHLAAKGLTAPQAQVHRLSGSIADLAAGTRSGFQLWFDPADPSGLPLCFEFQPRSFLRLVFEWDGGAITQESVSALFHKEDA